MFPDESSQPETYKNIDFVLKKLYPDALDKANNLIKNYP